MDAADWDRRYAAEQLVWGAEPNRFVVELVAALPPGRAVDLACGEGRNALWLAGQGWAVTAVDFSAVAVDRGRQLAEQAGVELDWRCADVEAEPVPAADLVLLAYLHLPAARRAAILSRAASAVRPAGALLLVGHDRRNLHEGVGGPQEQDLLWTPADVLDLGLTAVHAQTRARPVGARTAWDTVALLVRTD